MNVVSDKYEYGVYDEVKNDGDENKLNKRSSQN